MGDEHSSKELLEQHISYAEHLHMSPQYGTPTKRQVSKRQVSKRLVSKRPVSKRQVYKTSGLQNVRFQNIWFQNVQFLNLIYLLNKKYLYLSVLLITGHYGDIHV